MVFPAKLSNSSQYPDAVAGVGAGTGTGVGAGTGKDTGIFGSPGARASDVVAIALLAILANIWVSTYIGQEHYVYHWDWSGYWLRFRDSSAAIISNPFKALVALVSSIRNEDYNLLPVWPLAPFGWLLGVNRSSYVMAVTTAYLVPAVMLFGWLIARLFAVKSTWLPATAVIVMSHPLWIPVLRGYPDVVGLLIIAALLHLHFSVRDLPSSVTRALLTAGLLCLMVVMRRWYAFWVVSFVPMLALMQIEMLRRAGTLSIRSALLVTRDAAIATVGFVVLVFIVATPFAIKMATTSYADIYAAYRLSGSMGEVLTKLLGYFGTANLLAALAGLFIMISHARLFALGALLLAQSVLIFLMFARTQDFGEQHYYLLMPAYALGIAALAARLWLIATKPALRIGLVGLLLAVIGLGSLQVLAPKAIETTLPGLAQVRYPPLVRNDFDQLELLLAHLDQLQRRTPGDIYVLSSSTLLNSSIVQNHCRFNEPTWAFCAKVQNTHDVDRRDGFPLRFLDARYVLVTEPVQYHLRPADQRVIGTLSKAIGEGGLLSAAYRRMPEEFELERGVKVTVYRRYLEHEKSALRLLQVQFLQHYPETRYGFRLLEP